MSGKKWGLPLFIVLTFIAVALIAARVQRPAEAQLITCRDPIQGCVFMHRNRPVRLDFSSLPSAMRPFTLHLQAPGVNRVHAEFQMVGMNMGFNRYDLHAVAPGVFTASITLPVCVSGRHDWKLYLQIDQEHYMVPFNSS